MQMIDYKVPGGKLLRIKAEIQDGKIDKVMILGDFFVHPEDAIEEIEKSLYGCPLNKNDILERINRIISRGVSIIGFSAEDVAEVLLQMK